MVVWEGGGSRGSVVHVQGWDVKGVVGSGGWVYRFHSIDLLPKLWLFHF